MGIKDTCYASSFDGNDLPYLYRFAEEVRATHNQNLVDDFNLKCQKKVDDHNAVLEIGNKKIEFSQVSKADDLVVDVGIQRCVDQILGVSVVRWRYMIITDGTGTPLVTDVGLTGAQAFSSDMSLQGWREYASTSLRFAGIFGNNTGSGSVTINQAGVSPIPPPTAGMILNRNVFSNVPVTWPGTLSPQTGIVISSIVEFVPVV